ncbi:MAG: glycosyltransferase [Patescibacteria group bacterium]
MKNILYLTENLDFYADSGAKIKTINTLRCLDKNFNIKVLSLNSTKQLNKKYQKNFKNLDFIYLTDQKIEVPVKKRLLETLANYLLGRPYYFFQYKNLKFQNLVNDTIRSLKPDCIHIDHLTMAQYLPKIKNEQWIYEEHNIEYKLRLQMAKFSKKIGYHWLIWLIESLFLYFQEIKIIKKFDYIFAISKSDQQFLTKITKKNNVYLQNIFMPYKKSKKKNETISRTLLFVGDLEWLPNRNGISWFIKKILPKLDNVKLQIVGKVDHGFKQQYSNAKINFLGYQKEISNFFNQADIFIVPLKIGEGVRLKILDAFARQIPVISSKNAIKGLAIKHKQELLIAKNQFEFVSLIKKVLDKKIETNTILENALSYLKENHSDEENKKFIKRYQEILG